MARLSRFDVLPTFVLLRERSVGDPALFLERVRRTEPQKFMSLETTPAIEFEVEVGYML